MKTRNLIALLLLLLTQCAPILKDRFSTSEEIIEFVERGGDPNLGFNQDKGNPKSMLRPLHWAVRNDDPDLVLFLLERGADPNGRDYMGQTPLMNAFTSLYEPRNIDNILTQLASKSDLTATDNNGDTVFALIEQYSNPAWKDRLLKSRQNSVPGSGGNP